MNNKHKDNNLPDDTRHQADQSRRDFLKKSKYAVYATPLMTGLIISSNAAHASPCNPGGPCASTTSDSENNTGF